MQKTIQNEKSKTTKRYDVVAKKIRKLLSASAQTFIPELCEALREDWFAEYTREQIKNVKEARENIRDKVMEDWSYEHGGRYSEDNIWSDLTIRTRFPDWLKDPIMQSDSRRESLRRATEAKIALKSSISVAQKEKLDELATKLPDTVILPKPKEPEPVSDEKLHDLGLATYGDAGKTIHRIRNEIHEGARIMFKALCNDKDLPHVGDDLFNDFIKPTREFRLGLAMEFDEGQRTHMHNVLHYVSEAIEDMIEQLEKAEKK